MTGKYNYDKMALKAIYCDGGMNKQTGDKAYGSVVDDKGNDLLCLYKELLNDMEIQEVNLPVGKRIVILAKFNDVKQQQNNGAELLALVAALRIADTVSQPCPIPVPINCDSELLTKWWSKGHVNAKTKLSMDPVKLKYIEECTKLRTKVEMKGYLLVKISGSLNKADLGYHK